MARKIIMVTAALWFILGTAPALAQEGPSLMPKSMWISGDPADLAPLVGTVWEFTTYMDGAEPASETVIFTDSIVINQGTGSAVLGTMFPECDPPPGPTGPVYAVCGASMYVRFGQGQKALFDNLNDYGFGTVLIRPAAAGFVWYWFNIYNNGLDEPGLAIGYSEFSIEGVHFPPTLMEGRRIFSEDELPPDEPLPEE